jgi:hypothetical protein
MERGDGTLRLLTDLADGSLQDEFAGACAKGLAGVPRERLLAVLREVAEALDFFHVRAGVPHLGVEPGHILLVAGHAKLSEPRPGRRRAMTPTNWTAPEGLAGAAVPATDQFALAALYAALLGGIAPFEPSALARMAVGARVNPPRFENVPEADLPALRTALAPNAERRYPNCATFIQALSGGLAPLALAVEEFPSAALKPRSRERHSTITPAMPHVTKSAREVFRRELRAVSASLDWTFAEPAPWRFTLGCQGGQRGRAFRDGWLTTVSAEHLGDRLPADVFGMHAKVLVQRLAGALKLAEAPGAAARQHARRRYSGRVIVEPRTGPFAGLRISCAGFDLALRGAGMISAFAVPAGPARFELEGVGLGLEGTLVRARKLTGDLHLLGAQFAEELPAADARLVQDQPTERQAVATFVVGSR